MSLLRDEERFCESLAQETASLLAKKSSELCLQNGATQRHATELLESFLINLRREFNSMIDKAANNSEKRRTKGKKAFRLLSTRKVRSSDCEAVQKEGVLKQLINAGGLNLDWVKCRVVLLCSPGGSMIEFYSPPKASQPKSGILCRMIYEVKQTTKLELDARNTFVIKASRIEYILQAENDSEMHLWMEIIQQSMGGSGEMEDGDNLPVVYRRPSSRPSSTSSASLSTTSPTTGINNGLISSQASYLPAPDSEDDIPLPPPDEPLEPPPPPPPEEIVSDSSRRSLSLSESPPSISPLTSPHHVCKNSLRHSGGSFCNGDITVCPVSCDGSQNPRVNSLWPSSLHADIPGVVDPEHPLARYLWFHGMLKRDIATTLVQSGVHGTWLVRQSGTRQGEYVLTFNYQTKAKHLRISLNSEGHCRVEHLWFHTIFDMLDHFKASPIPLESNPSGDVTLSDFVPFPQNHMHNTVFLPPEKSTDQSTCCSGHPRERINSYPERSRFGSVSEGIVHRTGSVTSQSLDHSHLLSTHLRAANNPYSYI